MKKYFIVVMGLCFASCATSSPSLEKMDCEKYASSMAVGAEKKAIVDSCEENKKSHSIERRQNLMEIQMFRTDSKSG